MRFPLGTLSIEEQRNFLDYFNAGLRARRASSNGNGTTLADGSYSLVLTGPFPVDADAVLTTWKLLWSAKDELPQIDVEADATSIASYPLWETAIREFIGDVRSAAVAKETTPHFRREAFHYIGYNLNGEFWLPGFRLAPAVPDDNVNLSHMVFGEERVLHIDQTVEAIDEVHAIQLGEERAARTAARLSLLLGEGLYHASRESRWTLFGGITGGAIHSERRPLGFLDPRPTVSMPTPGEGCVTGQYVGSISKPLGYTCTILRVPEEIPAILAGVDAARHRDQEAFDASARLYQVSRVVNQMFPSVALAYLVSAAEAIPKRTRDYNGDFSPFVRAHTKAFPARERLLDTLYRAVRSSHFHAGRFEFGERDPSWHDITDPESLRRVELQGDAYTLLREAIITWVARTFSASPAISPEAARP